MAFDIKRLIVTGANGFVGRALCTEALVRGIEVLGAARHYGQLPVGVKSIAVGDIDHKNDWQNVLVGCDVVIHLAARVHVMQEYSENPLAEFRCVNVAGTERLARSAVAAGVKRFIFVSSIGVNGLLTGPNTKFIEADIPLPHNAYALSKWEAEQVLHQVAKETGLEVVIVRPPLVYGAGVKGNFAQMIKVLKLGLPLPLATIHNQRSFIYVKNLVDALILCATHPLAADNTYLVSDNEDLSTSELLRKLSIDLGVSPRLFSCPEFILKYAGKLFGKSDQVARLVGSLQIDSSRIRNELGWQPPFTVDEGLKATVNEIVKS